MLETTRKQRGKFAPSLVRKQNRERDLGLPSDRGRRPGESKTKKMSFSVRAMSRFGEVTHRRGTSDAALRKARELAKSGCYDIHIITPQGRDYHSSEFGDFPKTSVADRRIRKTAARPAAGLHQHFSR